MSISIPTFILQFAIKTIGKIVVKKITEKESGKNDGDVYCYREEEKKGNLILFIHGFTGSATETFANVPELLIKEPQLKGYDVFSIGYSSSILPDIAKGIWSADPDVNTLSNYLETLLTTRFKAYGRVTIIAHSMGGLVTQRCTLNLDTSNLKRIKHLLFFGTPSGGLNVANLRVAKKMKSQIKNMGSESEFITSLRTDWNNTFSEGYPFEDFKVVAGNSDEFIPQTSSLKPFAKDHQYLIEGNHSTMVKAKSDTDTENLCFRMILDSVIPTIVQERYGTNIDSYLVNTVMAKASDVVDKLDDNISKLTPRDLRSLILALDTLGKDDDAIAILESHPITATHSDFKGILGGRYKRKYLYHGSDSEDAKNAWETYLEGYDMAANAIEVDKNQVFYLAINVAFFYLVYKEDKSKMKEFAEIALANCDPETTETWEMATLAEGNLYLGNEDKAEEYYNQVFEENKNNIRVRHSIYLNAKFAYEALNGVEY